MNVKELKEKLNEFPDDAEVRVSYSVRNECHCGPDDYCYCGYEDREETVSYLCAKEVPTRKDKHPVIKTVIISL